MCVRNGCGTRLCTRIISKQGEQGSHTEVSYIATLKCMSRGLMISQRLLLAYRSPQHTLFLILVAARHPWLQCYTVLPVARLLQCTLMRRLMIGEQRLRPALAHAVWRLDFAPQPQLLYWEYRQDGMARNGDNLGVRRGPLWSADIFPRR